ETVHEKRRDRVERAATTAASLDVVQDCGTINRTQSMATPNEPIPQGTSSGGSPRRQDTILGDRPAQTSINITTVEPVPTVSASITNVGVSVSIAEPNTPPTTTKIMIEDEDLHKLDEKVEAEVDSDKKEAEMKMYIKIILDDEVAIDAISLATKPPIIVDWKIIKEGKIGSYHIITTDGSSKRRNEVFGYILLVKIKLFIKKLKYSEGKHQVYGRIIRNKRLFSVVEVAVADMKDTTVR
nr:hypothetical protein [Tanacetum cinerariifolium]